MRLVPYRVGIVLVTGVLALGGLITGAGPQGQPDLRRFDPIAVGAAEAELWRAYYDHRYATLAMRLVLFNRTQYGFSLADSLRSGLSAMRAAQRFQISQSRDEAMAALPALIDHFAVIRQATHARFDPVEAARLELDWWQARRENVGVAGYASLIAAATAYVYEIAPGSLAAYARLRAEAMDLRDTRADRIREDDWQTIADRLMRAYQALHAATALPSMRLSGDQR
ncbi:hypothetical protein [Microvirga sp. VF16]|uniref:hypothetical protein n=1 Tax=Microvirga sp. VF16 TaxID=2807101 RepID=UPI00193D0783|nr:hypothetical protein [Microvirga sp. VF16]QRM35370.1 hypothetical protein JO965_44190 [Microvirga sp. VF16]